MNESRKREREVENDVDYQEEGLKRFEGKSLLICIYSLIRKMISWTKETKDAWIQQSSCSSVFGDTSIFICKQVLDGM